MAKKKLPAYKAVNCKKLHQFISHVQSVSGPEIGITLKVKICRRGSRYRATAGHHLHDFFYCWEDEVWEETVLRDALAGHLEVEPGYGEWDAEHLQKIYELLQ